MGLLSDLLGGTDDSAQKETIRQNQATQEFIKQQTEKARQDALTLFPASQETVRQGFQGALDIFGQSMPQQRELMQQGNIDAQNLQAAGLGAFRDAILGNPVNLQGFVPNRLDAGGMTMPELPPAALGSEMVGALQGNTGFRPGMGGNTMDWDRLFANNPDLAQAYGRASGWADTPQQWGNEWWFDEARRGNDPRYLDALKGIY